MDIIKSKIEQASSILKELDIDCWVIYLRESTMSPDPAMDMVVGHDVTWRSLFVYTKTGEVYALVGQFDQDNFIRSGYFTEVLTYTEDQSQDIIDLFDRIKPKQIAVNYSTDNVAADGISHGMFMILSKYLEGTPYEGKLISSEPLISKLRSRKLPKEITLVKKAAELAEKVWHQAMKDIQIGMTEIQIATIIEYYILNTKNKPSFPTIVNAGDKSRPGHSMPTNAKIEKGDLLHIDFGIRHEGFCSDIQRLLYFKKDGEVQPPEDLISTFNIIRDIITETGKISKPGIQGHEVDALARKMLTDNGYPEYQHALGHQLGRDVHDGGAILGPKWERYGKTPTIPLELNNIFTLELEIMLPDIGCVGLEEDMIVTENGAEYLCPRQLELYVK